MAGVVPVFGIENFTNTKIALNYPKKIWLIILTHTQNIYD